MSSADARVVSLVSILVDLSVHVPALPPRSGDVVGDGLRREVGGGFNLAAAVARQGVTCLHAAPHGTGPNGDLVRAALAAEGITPALPISPEQDTGFCIALVEPDGERTYVTVPGAEAHQDAEALSHLATHTSDLVALSGYDLTYPVSGPALVAWLASQPPGRIALDPGPLIMDIPGRSWDVLVPQLAILTMNEREARLLTGSQGGDGDAVLKAVRRALPLPPGTLVVIREGDRGCIATGGQLGERRIPVPAPEVVAVDTSGAGDTHTGVLLARLAEGAHPLDALRAANAAAASSVTRPGPATAPRRSAGA